MSNPSTTYAEALVRLAERYLREARQARERLMRSAEKDRDTGDYDA